MSQLAGTAIPIPARDGAEPRSVRVEVHQGLVAAKASWRALEARGLSSPYQRFDWVRAFVSGVTPGADIRLAIVSDPGGRPILVLPLAIERRAGLRVATAIGGKHSNMNPALHAAGHGGPLSGDEVASALRQVAAAAGIDVFALAHVPAVWNGVPNPLAALGTPSPSNAYEVRLERDPDATALRSMTNEARKRLRNKERGLARLGEVTFGQAQTEADVDRLLEAFFRQKEERFRELGISDPFLDSGVRAFIRAAACDGLADGEPPIELYGLYVGGKVAAVLGGAADAHRLSGMFISFEACKEATKYSPGDILVSRVVRDQCQRGRGFFDLGVGDARYKRTFCDETLDLVDVVMPVTLRGRLYAGLLHGAAALKRRVKASPRAMQLLARLRRARAAA